MSATDEGEDETNNVQRQKSAVTQITHTCIYSKKTTTKLLLLSSVLFVSTNFETKHSISESNHLL